MLTPSAFLFVRGLYVKTRDSELRGWGKSRRILRAEVTNLQLTQVDPEDCGGERESGLDTARRVNREEEGVVRRRAV